MARATLLAGLILASLCAFASPRAAGASVAGLAVSPLVVPDVPLPGKSGYLARCAALTERKMVACYIDGLYADVEKSGDPARELPRIDKKVHAEGGFLESACHSFMHVVGRRWAKTNHVTLANLYRFVPRSNDPGCSAGFGMGMAMYLGPQLVLDPRAVLKTCDRLPTRYRQYTCVHGSGHAFMRGFHSELRDAVRACVKLGPTNAPDCAQGAFHDYWISLGGADGTTRPAKADTSPRSVCSRTTFVRPCWYRYFWERKPGAYVYRASDITRLCTGLVGLQRQGCIGGASLLMSRARDPVDHARTCRALTGADTLSCLRGVAVPAVASKPFDQLSLIRTCAKLPTTTRYGCFAWFGRTLAVVTDGRFGKTGCRQLAGPRARRSCVAGAAHMWRPLETFS